MTVLIYAGNAGDRNLRGPRGAHVLGTRIAVDLGLEARPVGRPSPLVEGGWCVQLGAASDNLCLLAEALAEPLQAGDRPILSASRCAASIATLPQVAAHHPDAAIVWFDAHGDSNVPNSETNYLGGMVIAGAAGEWDTGFGAGLDFANVILVGSRDLDPPEQARIDAGQITLVPPGPALPARLREAIRGRPVYIHLDCDVLDAGLLATEYQAPGGLSYADLREAFEVLAQHDLLGLEVAEYEDCWPDGTPCPPDDLLDAIRPGLDALRRDRARHQSHR